MGQIHGSNLLDAILTASEVLRVDVTVMAQRLQTTFFF